MRVELCRLIAACLTDGGVGVNVQIAAMTTDGTDAKPANVASVKNAADDNLSLKEADVTFPLLLVDCRQPIQMQGFATSGIRLGTASVTVSYLVESGVAAKNYRDADYTLRCAVKAIHAKLWAGTGSDAARKRNSIAIANSPSFSIGPTDQEHGAGVAIASLNQTFNVRDQSP